jgi:hypothetical protein
MNEDTINELQALLDAGTQGEWEVKLGTTLVCGDEELLIGWSVDEGDCCNFEANLPLVAELHNHAPALLEAARENLRLREQLGIMIWLCDEHADFRRAGGTPVEGPIMAKRYIKQAKAALGKETV